MSQLMLPAFKSLTRMAQLGSSKSIESSVMSALSTAEDGFGDTTGNSADHRGRDVNGGYLLKGVQA